MLDAMLFLHNSWLKYASSCAIADNNCCPCHNSNIIYKKNLLKTVIKRSSKNQLSQKLQEYP